MGYVVTCRESGARDGAPFHQRRLIIRFHSCGGACRRRLVLDEEQLGTAHLRAWPGECGRGPIGVEGQPKLVAHELQVAELLGGREAVPRLVVHNPPMFVTIVESAVFHGLCGH